VSQHQKGKTTLDFIEARDGGWQWHQLSHMQVCTLLQTDNHASTPPLSFLQAGCPSCRPTNSIKALKAVLIRVIQKIKGGRFWGHSVVDYSVYISIELHGLFSYHHYEFVVLCLSCIY